MVRMGCSRRSMLIDVSWLESVITISMKPFFEKSPLGRAFPLKAPFHSFYCLALSPFGSSSASVLTTKNRRSADAICRLRHMFVRFTTFNAGFARRLSISAQASDCPRLTLSIISMHWFIVAMPSSSYFYARFRFFLRITGSSSLCQRSMISSVKRRVLLQCNVSVR